MSKAKIVKLALLGATLLTTTMSNINSARAHANQDSGRINGRLHYWVSWKAGQTGCKSFAKVIATERPGKRFMCNLSEVSGGFDGLGEYVKVDLENGAWVLRAQACNNRQVKATARCLRYN